jgi:catechol 2,3-dioxygenase-like lactoylglutathione lyase family enzyme
VRRIIAGMCLFVGLFVACFGIGNGRQAILVVGIAIMLLALTARVVTSFRRTPRQWLRGTGLVIEVSEPPVDARLGRCSLQLVLDVPDLPEESVIVHDSRVPVNQWPQPGQTLPIQVAADDIRNVRVLWRDFTPVEMPLDAAWGDDQPGPAPATPPGSHLDLSPVIDFDLDHPPTGPLEPREPPEVVVPVASAEASPADEGSVRGDVPLTTERADPAVPPGGTGPAGPASGPAGPAGGAASGPVGGAAGGAATTDPGGPAGGLIAGQADGAGPAGSGPTASDPTGSGPGGGGPGGGGPGGGGPGGGGPGGDGPAAAPGSDQPGTAGPADPQARVATTLAGQPVVPHPRRKPSPRPRRTAAVDGDAGSPPGGPGPSAISGVGITMLVGELARSVTFYRDRLGFREVDQSAGTSVLASGGTRLVLRQAGDIGAVKHRLVHLNLEVTDIDAAYAQLKATGIRFTYPPRAVDETARLQLWAAAFKDPDGHGIALTQWRPAT